MFCYSARGSSNDCAAKEGNPFGPYWDNFGIDFDKNEFYGPLSFDPNFEKHRLEWIKRFPADKYPVLAFTGAPGAFPVIEAHVPLHKYLKWSETIDMLAQEFIDQIKNSSNENFIGIHLRNGIDFVIQDKVYLIIFYRILSEKSM